MTCGHDGGRRGPGRSAGELHSAALHTYAAPRLERRRPSFPPQHLEGGCVVVLCTLAMARVSLLRIQPQAPWGAQCIMPLPGDECCAWPREPVWQHLAVSRRMLQATWCLLL